MAKKKVITKAKTELKEECTRCGSKEYSVDSGLGYKRFCEKCRFVWTPMSEDALKLLEAKRDNTDLLNRINQLNKEVNDLKHDLFLKEGLKPEAV